MAEVDTVHQPYLLRTDYFKHLSKLFTWSKYFGFTSFANNGSLGIRCIHQGGKMKVKTSELTN